MLDSCARACELGLPSIAFTEHVDAARWIVPAEADVPFPPFLTRIVDGVFDPPELDVDGYFEAVDDCQARFPDLRIVPGLEIGEPHWFPDATRRLLAAGPFIRVLGSLHSVGTASAPRLIDEWYFTEEITDAAEDAAVESYLAEAIRLIETCDHFEVFAHIDYLTRQITRAGREHDPRRFEDAYRETLTSLARSGRVLEINTRLPLDPIILRWWYEVGGAAVSFGSDAHEGPKVGAGFAAAAAAAESVGFRPQHDPHDFWRRTG